jgi:hypothetical protein
MGGRARGGGGVAIWQHNGAENQNWCKRPLKGHRGGAAGHAAPRFGLLVEVLCLLARSDMGNRHAWLIVRELGP